MTMYKLAMGVEGDIDTAGYLEYEWVGGNSIATVIGRWGGKLVKNELPIGKDNWKELYRTHGVVKKLDALWLGIALFGELCNGTGVGGSVLLVDKVAHKINEVLIDDDNPDIDLDKSLLSLLKIANMEFSVDGRTKEVAWQYS